MGIDTLQDLRDVTIVAFTIAGTLLFLAAIIVTIVVGFTATAAFRAIHKLVDDNVKPMIANVQGTVTFISDTTVSPIIRAYSIYAGVRRGMGALSGLTERGGDKGSQKRRK
jgi:hypothetical protein